MEFQAKPSYGFTIPASRLLKGGATDHLLSYDDNSHYWQPVGLALFFDKHWGLELTLQGTASSKNRNRDKHFIQAMEAEYGNDYFVTASTGAGYLGSGFLGSAIDRGFLGVVYRLESNRFFLYPKAAIGITSFSTDWGRAYLKEKDANTVIDVYYNRDKAARDHFSLATSASAGYKLTKWLYLNVDAMTTYYRAKVAYSKTITDLNLKQSVVENIVYKKPMLILNVGAGFIISLKW